MTHYIDLSSCDYFGPADGRLLAVGWLELGRPLERGRVTGEFFEAFARLAANAWQPFVHAGRHACQWCVFSGGPAEVRVGDLTVAVGATNVFVPAEQAMYVAPSLLLHYMDAHEYAPPEVFQRAVIACPTMRSMDYLKALRAHGIDRLGRQSGQQ